MLDRQGEDVWVVVPRWAVQEAVDCEAEWPQRKNEAWQGALIKALTHPMPRSEPIVLCHTERKIALLNALRLGYLEAHRMVIEAILEEVVFRALPVEWEADLIQKIIVALNTTRALSDAQAAAVPRTACSPGQGNC